MPEAPTGSRRRRGLVLVLAVVAGVLLLTATVAVPAYLANRVVAALTGDEVAATTGPIEGLEVHDGLRRDHVVGPIEYDLAPPVGGPHHPAWLECGSYDVPVPEELMVHSLEHGTIWITYRAGIAEEELAALAAVLPEEGVLSPHPEQEAPVVVTAWGRRLPLEGAGDDRLRRFVETFADGHTAPEPRASCHGGVTLEDTRPLPGPGPTA